MHQTLVAEVGAGPMALDRAQRAQTARVLLQTTQLPITDIAFAAGFASVRQFNDTVRAVFATTPSALRRDRRGTSEPGVLALRLPYREPMQLGAVLDFLGAHVVTGVEHYRAGVFTRVMSAPHGPALVSLSAADGAVAFRVRLHDVRDLVVVVARVRHLLDLDADPVAVDDLLGRDAVLAPLLLKRPGLRSPGSVDGFETVVRTIVGQQISLAGARTVLGRIVAEHGSPAFPGEPWLLFPSPSVLAAVDPARLPMPRARGRSVQAVAAAVAGGALEIDTGADRDELRSRLLALPGIGPWTADYLRMRAGADPDVLLGSDLVVRRAAVDLGVDLAGGRPDWSPWRSYATHHLWAHLVADSWAVRS